MRNGDKTAAKGIGNARGQACMWTLGEESVVVERGVAGGPGGGGKGGGGGVK